MLKVKQIILPGNMANQFEFCCSEKDVWDGCSGGKCMQYVQWKFSKPLIKIFFHIKIRNKRFENVKAKPKLYSYECLYVVILARHPIKSFFRTIESKMTSTSLKRSISSGFYLIICMCQECCGKMLNGCCSELSQDGGSDHTSQSAEVNVSACQSSVKIFLAKVIKTLL